LAKQGDKAHLALVLLKTLKKCNSSAIFWLLLKNLCNKNFTSKSIVKIVT
jgi:hypothetical protein